MPYRFDESTFVGVISRWSEAERKREHRKQNECLEVISTTSCRLPIPTHRPCLGPGTLSPPYDPRPTTAFV